MSKNNRRRFPNNKANKFKLKLWKYTNILSKELLFILSTPFQHQWISILRSHTCSISFCLAHVWTLLNTHNSLYQPASPIPNTPQFGLQLTSNTDKNKQNDIKQLFLHEIQEIGRVNRLIKYKLTHQNILRLFYFSRAINWKCVNNYFSVKDTFSVSRRCYLLNWNSNNVFHFRSHWAWRARRSWRNEG